MVQVPGLFQTPVGLLLVNALFYNIKPGCFGLPLM